jgi:branched-chain amino acid transport system permease protein
MLVQQLLNGLMLGAVYGLAGIGMSLIWAVLKFVNIAHGNVIIVGAYAGFFIGSLTGSTILAIFSGLLVPILLNFLLNQCCFEKVRLENHLVPLMVSIGLGIMIEEILCKLFYGGRPVTYPNNIQILKVYSLGGINVGLGHLVGLGITLAIMSFLYFLLFRSRFGMGLRATAEDPRIAQMLGINGKSMARSTFLLAGGVGGVSGVLYGVIYAGISPYSGPVFTFKALAVMLFAGAGNVPGALVAGCIIGITEVLAVGYGMGMWRDFIIFGIIIIILLFRPKGLFGTIYEVE